MIWTAVAALALVLVAVEAPALDEGLYATVLQLHTTEVDDIASVRVDYAALSTSPSWEQMIVSLRESDPRRVRSRKAKIAFWLNAYNILAIDLVRRHYPTDSIRSIGGFFTPVWKKPAGEIDGRSYTLHEIEHEILRSMDEPRIHGAMSCASVSCPPLRREPYRETDLYQQLDDNVRRWLADSRKGARIDRATRTLRLSRIFDWFSEDFGDSVLPFVADYLPDEEASFVREQGDALRIRYFDYDWSLNDASTAAPVR